MDCLRCGVAVSHLGTCMDCRQVDPQMCTRLTAEARRYRTPSGMPRNRFERIAA